MRSFLRGLAVSAAVIGSGFTLGCQSGQSNTRIYFEARNDPGILDGETKSILINGYSTSYAWPDMLQDMLDDHASGERVYYVVNAVIGGAPVESWIGSPGSSDYERTISAMERDFMGPQPKLLDGAPRPTIAICQQSLQLTGDQRGPVKTPHDMAGAEVGADAMQKLAQRLHSFGLDRIYIAMHIYKEPVEPEVGNERVALARLLSRGIPYIEEGPDVWAPTQATFPDSYSDDRLHPNEMGMKIMAEGWYRTLARRKAREGVIRRMWETDYDVETMMRAYLAWRRGE